MSNPTPSINANLHYLKTNPARLHPDPIWNDGPLRFYRAILHRARSWNCMSSVCPSVPCCTWLYTVTVYQGQ